MQQLSTWFQQDWKETKVLFKCVPAIPFAILCEALVAMNFLAGKGIVPAPYDQYIQLDAGIIVSWVTFLAGDTVVKRFGAKAAIKVNFAAILIELFALVLFTAGSFIPWSVTPGDYEATWDSIFRLSIWPLAAGTIAFLIAIAFDSFTSKFILTRFKDKQSFKAYFTASSISTMVGQFLDNLLFGLLFSVWQPWFSHFSAIWLFAGAGMVVELICQLIFSPVGFRLANSWRKRGLGQEYIDMVKDAQDVNN